MRCASNEAAFIFCVKYRKKVKVDVSCLSTVCFYYFNLYRGGRAKVGYQ